MKERETWVRLVGPHKELNYYRRPGSGRVPTFWGKIEKEPH